MSKQYPRSAHLLTVAAFCLSTVAASAQSGMEAKDASGATMESNHDMAASQVRQEDQDFEFVQRGFVARRRSTVIRDASGKVVWNMDQFANQEIDAPVPDTVNPSLWCQARPNSQHGLYKITDRIYQVRGHSPEVSFGPG